jgi:hypothetical protein
MSHRRIWPTISIATALLISCGFAAAQTQGDPIGALTKTATFDRAHKIDVGRSSSGVTACYFREEGDSHRLDIGVTVDGAFIRLETPEDRDATPAGPVRVFAGKQTDGDGWTTLKAYDGEVDFHTPQPPAGGFTVTAAGDPKAFLQMVAAGAPRDFVVVQSQADPKVVAIVAVYHFSTRAIPALLTCAKERLRAQLPNQPSSPAAAPSAGWTTYANPRFGTAVDYPAAIFSVRDAEPANGGGQSFRSADGRATLSIYGSHNVEDDTPQSYLDKYVETQGVSYKRVTRQFFAVSGKRGGEIFYQRCNFAAPPSGVLHCVSLSYPADQAGTYDGVAGTISKSLRAGKTGD